MINITVKNVSPKMKQQITRLAKDYEFCSVSDLVKRLMRKYIEENQKNITKD